VTPTPTIRRRGRWLGCEDRIAWLLRINRLYGTDRRLAVGREFARALSHMDRAHGIDAAQVTRWERATQRVNHEMIGHYEELLGIENRSLGILADTLYREARGSPGRPTLPHPARSDPGAVRHRTYDLIDTALSPQAMTGRDWDELTVNLWDLGNVFLYPRGAWGDLVGRLLAEMIIADGTSWLLRSEALNRLLGHPDGDLAVIDACASLAADRRNQVSIEPLTVLEISPNPLAARRLLEQILDPTNAHTRRGAWWAVAEKVARGHFGPDDLAILTREATTLLTSEGGDPSCRMAAAELLRQTWPSSADARLRPLVEGDGVTRNVLLTGLSGERHTSHAVVSRVSAASMARMPFDVFDSDPILDILLTEMLFHPQISRRVHAAKLIEATPYRGPVGQALTAELRRPAVLADPALTAALLNAAAHLIDPDGRTLVERFVMDPGLPLAITETAVWALAHVRGDSDATFWARACGRLFALAEASPAAMSAVRGLTYSIGIDRDLAVLLALRDDPNVPAAARASAAWWLNMPDHVLRSAADQ
jgi:hypothetical protein